MSSAARIEYVSISYAWPSFLSLLNFSLFILLFIMYWHFRVCGLLLLVQHFRFLLHFVQSKMNCSETKRNKLFSLCFSLYFFSSSPCPRRNCFMAWNLQDWRPSPLSLSLGDAYSAVSLKLINGVWEVFLFVTKLNMLFSFCFAGSRWTRANSKVQNFSCYRLPDTAISIWKNSIPDSIWLCSCRIFWYNLFLCAC